LPERVIFTTADEVSKHIEAGAESLAQMDGERTHEDKRHPTDNNVLMAKVENVLFLKLEVESQTPTQTHTLLFLHIVLAVSHCNNIID
jgi:hypothetical protein